MSMRRLATILIASALLAACSMAEFGYDLMPRLMVKYADDYLYLSKRQEAEALARFEQRLGLHARDELPRYLEYLSRVQERVDRGFDAAALETTLDEGEELIELGIDRTLPSVAEMLADLDQDQADYFGERLQEKSDEYRKRIEEGRSREKDIEEDIEELAEWTGELAEPQKKLLRDYMNRMDDTRKLWLAWRIERNQRLVDLLNASPGKEGIQEFLHASWVKRASIPAELKASTEKNRRLYIEMMLALQDTLSEEQFAAVREKLGEYRELVVSIMPDDIQVAAAK